MTLILFGKHSHNLIAKLRMTKAYCSAFAQYSGCVEWFADFSQVVYHVSTADTAKGTARS